MRSLQRKLDLARLISLSPKPPGTLQIAMIRVAREYTRAAAAQIEAPVYAAAPAYDNPSEAMRCLDWRHHYQLARTWPPAIELGTAVWKREPLEGRGIEGSGEGGSNAGAIRLAPQAQ